jgi:hypothetical protein
MLYRRVYTRIPHYGRNARQVDSVDFDLNVKLAVYRHFADSGGRR